MLTNLYTTNLLSFDEQFSTMRSPFLSMKVQFLPCSFWILGMHDHWIIPVDLHCPSSNSAQSSALFFINLVKEILYSRKTVKQFLCELADSIKLPSDYGNWGTNWSWMVTMMTKSRSLESTNEMLKKIPKKSINQTFTYLGSKFKGVTLHIYMYPFLIDMLSGEGNNDSWQNNPCILMLNYSAFAEIDLQSLEKQCHSNTLRVTAVRLKEATTCIFLYT